MQVVTLQRICVSGRPASPVVIAEKFATLSNPCAKGEVIILVLTMKRDVLQAVEKFGPTLRIREISIVFLKSHCRKRWTGTRASGLRLIRRLRARADATESFPETRCASGPCQE